MSHTQSVSPLAFLPPVTTAFDLKRSAVVQKLPRPASLRSSRRDATTCGTDGRSAQIREVTDLIGRLANAEVTVAILGETGSGKDVVARALHEGSHRAAKPFVVFDCGAVPANLVESELYGHERGAFTGAHSEHQGAFERARGGTLFLDEIGELPLELQPRLLRVLDNRRIRRVGGSREHNVEARVICATNRNLAHLVAAKKFREDLYFRLAGAVISVPPLRERKEDLPLLIPRLLEELGGADVQLSPAALDLLAAHSWPGNVRELRNTLACALAFIDGHRLEAHHIRLMASTSEPPKADALLLGGLTLESLERMAIAQTLTQSRGNKLHAARVLGIAPSTLYEKLKRYGMS